MSETTPRGIQATLFDYFKDTEYFSVQDAEEHVLGHQGRAVNRESIRARIYEGIDKGLFERVGKGLYTVTRKDEAGRENTCLLVNGDGRDLSFLADNSVDAIVTDHPYDVKKSLKGGNRNFADYELFQYTEEDMREKNRVLKPGCFLVEFLPEENADNYEYLFKVKDMARKAGLQYYSVVSWKKGEFVANTGRKAKNTENIVFFSKGRARDLRINAQQNKAYINSRTVVEFKEFIPGGVVVSYSDMGGMGSSNETKVNSVDVNIRLSVDKNDGDRVAEAIEKAFDNAVVDFFESSPLDKDNGGDYSLEELYDMPVQEYILRYLDLLGIEYVDLSPGPEDIFKADTDVIVNPTNLIGPMGAGLAKEFRDRYPGLETAYKESCRQRKYCSGVDGFKSLSGSDEILTSESRAMFEGNLFLVGSNEAEGRPAILCFPTKRDWKDVSDLDLIESGLKTFVRNYRHFNIKSITFPKLGCGLGGLDWEKDVKPLMRKYLGGLEDIDVRICGDTLKSDEKEHFMSGTAGMLPCVFDVPVVHKKDKIHQAEKPVALLEQILRFVTKEDELVLDQFAGSGVLGEAALNTHRDSILLEKDSDTFNRLRERISALGLVKVYSEKQRLAVDVVVGAMEAHREGPEAYDAYIEYREGTDMSVKAAGVELCSLPKDQPDGVHEAVAYAQKITSHETYPKVLECSSRGDKRFSSLYAKVTINGQEKSIEEWFLNSLRTADGKKAKRGKAFDYVLDPFTCSKLPVKDAPDLYRGLWVTYLKKNPDLVKYAEQFDEFTDCFDNPAARDKQIKAYEADPFDKDAEFFYNNPLLMSGAMVIGAYVKGDRERLVGVLKCSHWYKNMSEIKSKSSSMKKLDKKTKSESGSSIDIKNDLTSKQNVSSLDSQIADAQKEYKSIGAVVHPDDGLNIFR